MSTTLFLVLLLSVYISPGKLQLLKSGKVRLLTESGKSYEVRQKMSTCSDILVLMH
jgi:hypothetical protein